MKVALLGYGRMGRLIDSMSASQDIDVVARIDKEGPITRESLKGAELCLDFSQGDAVLGHIGQACELGCDLVIGTTGWEAHQDAVRALVEESGVGAITSPNFSIGVQIFFRLVREAAHLFNRIQGYDVAGYELHHRLKSDSPSGTAIELSSLILEEMKSKKKAVYEVVDREILPEELQFTSVRCGSEMGKHTVIFDSPADVVQLTHEARNREGFALGALMAAKWVHGKVGLFTMDQLVETLLNHREKICCRK